MLQYTLTEQRRRRRRLCPSALCVKKYCAAAAGAACSTRLAQRRRVAICLDVYPHYTRRWGRRRRASVANESTVTCMTRHVKVAGRLGSRKYRFMIVSDNSGKRF